jgi:hypothetical protein
MSSRSDRRIDKFIGENSIYFDVPNCWTTSFPLPKPKGREGGGSREVKGLGAGNEGAERVRRRRQYVSAAAFVVVVLRFAVVGGGGVVVLD